MTRSLRYIKEYIDEVSSRISLRTSARLVNMSPIKKFQKFIAYWYQRYLLATELYMVEPWERAVIHIIFAILFSLVWWFNSSLVCGSIARLRNTSQMEPIS